MLRAFSRRPRWINSNKNSDATISGGGSGLSVCRLRGSHAARNRKFADSPLEGDGFELPVPREKPRLAAPAIITLARPLEGFRSAANSAAVSFLAERGGGRRIWSRGAAQVSIGDAELNSAPG